jgi:hypothetical protein
MGTPENPDSGEEADAAEDDKVEEADKESFPASDPPANWAGGAN